MAGMNWARLRLPVLLAVAGLLYFVVNSQQYGSSLPPCHGDTGAYWTNCVGTYTWPGGAKHVGGWRNNKPHGQGILYDSGGIVIREGIWKDGNFVTSDNNPNSAATNKNPLPNDANGQGPENIWRTGNDVVAPQSPVLVQPRFPGKLVETKVETQRSGKAESSIKLVKEAGTYTVPVRINGIIDLHFTVDSGATDVSIPADVVMTLMRAGTIASSDFVGEQTYRLADGSTVKSKTFRIRQLQVGDRRVLNVLGTISNVEGSLLLGQSFLSRFKSVKFDYINGMLVLE